MDGVRERAGGYFDEGDSESVTVTDTNKSLDKQGGKQPQ